MAQSDVPGLFLWMNNRRGAPELPNVEITLG